ncbi:NAD(P)-dependent oxidoreductase [Mucilaginibacter psychrotolerans]|uniref:NAD(P)-dependent oxidoreductase n=1 Tax=Mucilaginibacter psychrotolerans TaxID=1524096 RepID=A0A4Y8SHA3_9SPHI|nr:NAD(P)-dependent oxidoreductase [Mucilaginibacter psychrotolerans]TFF38005.1 NAD(P)-dependent oxidoreductase [Mucilaginibacter psychrotolerans]
MDKSRIGWIGLGLMGTPMAQQLIKAGYPVTVYNRNKDKEATLKAEGAGTAPTPAELIAQSAIIIIMVTDDKAIKDIFHGDKGLLDAGATGKVIINMSTVSPAISREIAGLCAAQGNAYLDAPVSGSVKQAETAQLVIMAGGDAATFEQVKPVLEVLGKSATLIGDVGAGNVAKLAINTLLAIHAQGLAEAVVLSKQNGIAPETLLNLLNNGALANPFMKIKGDAIINDNYKAAFSLNNIVKDLKLAQDIGLSSPLGEAALKTYEAAQAAFGEQDLIAVIKQIE